MAFKVGILCDNGNTFINTKEFQTIGSAVNFMIEAQRLLSLTMVLQDEYGRIILTKGIKEK